MTYGLAIDHVRNGSKVARTSWQNQHIVLMTDWSQPAPFFALKQPDNSFKEFIPAAEEMLAEDWEDVT